MKNRFGILPVVALVVCLVLNGIKSSQAALYAYDGKVILDSGAGNVTYSASAFNGSTFTINLGQSLLLGGAVTADGGNGAPASNGPEWAKLFYSIDGGGFSSIDLPYLTDYGTFGWKVTYQEAGGGMAQIGSGLTAGNHSLAIYFQAHDNNQPWDAYDSNGGANFIGTIQVVPEPTTVALGIFGGLALLGLVIRQVRTASSFKLQTLSVAPSL